MMSYSQISSDLPSGGHRSADSSYIAGPSKEDSYLATGYKISFCFSALFHLAGIVTCGFIYLIAYWRPDWAVFWKKHKVSLAEADTLVLKDIDGLIHVVSIKKEVIQENVYLKHFSSSIHNEDEELCSNYQESNSLDGMREVRYFVFQYVKYVWFENMFHCVIGIKESATIAYLLQSFQGFSAEQGFSRSKFYGKNEMSIDTKSICQLLITEVLNPFYIFQIASIILWSMDSYVLYASCIFFISCLSIGVSLFETRKQTKSLQHLIESSSPQFVQVLRINELGKKIVEEINASAVVPGDLLVIPSAGCIMACDAILLSGTAIVNESMLTGESVPITKLAFTSYEEGEIYSPEIHKKHTLFCGTNVIQTRYYGKEQVLALVTHTGFNTAKGGLVRSILYPRPIDFKFYKDSLYFIGFLFCIALIGMSYSIYLYIIYSKPVVQTIVRALDIITIVVPPALPAAMTVGTYYAQNRLKKLGIFCIAPARINICGKVKLVCFDKTGTLTEDSLEVWGAVGSEGHGTSKLRFTPPCFDLSKLPAKSNLAASLASCHSLTHVNGELTGDPLDLKMFEATKWTIEEPGESGDCYDSLIPPILRPPTDVSSVDGQDFSFSNSSLAPCPYLNLDDSISWKDKTHNAEALQNSKHDPGSEISYFDGISDDPFSVTTRRSLVSELQGEKDGSPPKVLEDATNLPDENEIIIESVVKAFSSNFVSMDSPLGLDLIQETSFQVPYEIGIVRQFPFSSSVQRMSVIVRVLGSPSMEVYSKGAPEVIQTLCKPETVPENFTPTLNHFATRGFRVLALAHKRLPAKFSWHNVQKMKRVQAETDLEFVGLIIFQNVLKQQTFPVIHELKLANIRTLMVTGDNILTGISVARDCGMIVHGEEVLLAKVSEIDGTHVLSFEMAQSHRVPDDFNETVDQVNISVNNSYHLAVSGPTWHQIKKYFPEYVPLIVAEGTIFARMSPDQKVQLVEELQAIDYIVGMCGDGANDCGALKAAHIGISLSEAEASVAAPFTSHTSNISCVPKVICEGRCALTTNFSVFKYMALYSIIQFVSVLILYKACSNLSDPQFLYIDLLIVTTVAIFMGHTQARHTLVPERPLSSLIGPMNLFSVISQIGLVIMVQVLGYYYLLWQPWYVHDTDCQGDDEVAVSSWETNVMFCLSSMQYLFVAIIFSPGYPFRKPLYTNVWLLISIIILTSTSLWLLVLPFGWMEHLMVLKPFPGGRLVLFRGTLLLMALFYFVLGWTIEYFIVGSKPLKSLFQLVFRKKKPKNKFKRVKQAIKEDSSWPPVENPIFSTVSS